MEMLSSPLSNSLQDPEKPGGDEVSSCFAISAGTALVGLENHYGPHLLGFAADAPTIYQSENGKNSDTQDFHSFVKAVDLAEIHQAADLADPGSCNTYLLEWPILF